MTSHSTQNAKSIVLNACQEMQKAALVIGSSGNASLRLAGSDQVAITPSSVDYSYMSADDVMILNLDGDVLEGELNPSIEHPLHLAIYKVRSDVNAIVHSHCIYASVLAVLRLPLPPIIDEFVRELGGQVEVADYGLTGSNDLAENVVKALGPRNAVLLANHGGVTVGSTMDNAMQNALLLERAAHIYLLAAAVDLKKITTLPPEAMETQVQMFEMMKRFKKK
jgi:L-fuculose-phosphate aldolase